MVKKSTKKRVSTKKAVKKAKPKAKPKQKFTSKTNKTVWEHLQFPFLAFIKPEAKQNWRGYIQIIGLDLLFIWLIVFSILLRSTMTLYFVPHLAFGGEMAKDYHERSSIMSYNNLGGYLGAAGAHFFSLKLIFVATAGYASGLLVPEAYNRFSTIASVMVFVALYACAWFTRDRIPTLSQPAADLKPFNFKDFFNNCSNPTDLFFQFHIRGDQKMSVYIPVIYIFHHAVKQIDLLLFF